MRGFIVRLQFAVENVVVEEEEETIKKAFLQGAIFGTRNEILQFSATAFSRSIGSSASRRHHQKSQTSRAVRDSPQKSLFFSIYSTTNFLSFDLRSALCFAHSESSSLNYNRR